MGGGGGGGVHVCSSAVDKVENFCPFRRGKHEIETTGENHCMTPRESYYIIRTHHIQTN